MTELPQIRDNFVTSFFSLTILLVQILICFDLKRNFYADTFVDPNLKKEIMFRNMSETCKVSPDFGVKKKTYTAANTYIFKIP